MTSSNKSFVSGLKKAISDLDKKKKNIDKRIKQTIKMYTEKHGPLASYFLDKPVNQYNDYDKKIADLNPDLFTISKQIDEYRNQQSMIDKDKINLENALKQIGGAYNEQESAINKSAESALSAIGTQKAVQQGALQGLAGKYGATSGMLAKGTAEIENAFAPKELGIEQQRQAGLAQVAAGKAGIPAQLSALQAQNIQNEQAQVSTEYNKAKLKQLLNSMYNRYNRYNTNTKTNTSGNTEQDENKKEIPDYTKILSEMGIGGSSIGENQTVNSGTVTGGGSAF